MTEGEEPLVRANIDYIAVAQGGRWPVAVAMLIEAHEAKHDILATRAVVRRLMERYSEAYFPTQALDIPTRRVVQRVMRARYFDRMDAYIRRVGRR